MPFCETRCNYCSFVTRPWRAEAAERYWRAVVAELEAVLGASTPAPAVDTLYFGGGTPSLVPPEQLAAILDACRRLVDLGPESEVTLEANPEDISPEKADAFRQLGFNRVSLGAESFDDGELRAIGRVHDSARTAEAVAMLRHRGFDNLNLDLIAGLPGQTETSWAAGLERLVALAPDHASIYMLELDDRAPLRHLVERGALELPDDDAVADRYLGMRARLGAAGYLPYEISNFARAGFESRHNLKYWRRQPVLGFGVGSHSFDGRARYANLSSLERYLAAVEAGRSPIEWRREITAREALEERLFLGLRLAAGLDCAGPPGALVPELEPFAATLDRLEADGLLERDAGRMRLTPRGILLSNEIFEQFV
jgi:oxygen-independent coproporphyrinogen-3 oxidase